MFNTYICKIHAVWQVFVKSCSVDLQWVTHTGEPATNVGTCKCGDIRLVGRSVKSEETAQVCISDNNWGTVCDDAWDNNDAKVVCAQLGYSQTSEK